MRCAPRVVLACVLLLPSASNADGSFQGLGFLEGWVFSTTEAISADGNVVVGIGLPPNTSGGEPFVWTQRQGMSVPFTTPDGFDSSVPTEISGDGSLIGGHYLSCLYRFCRSTPFIWSTARGFETLPVGPAGVGGLSADGGTAVGALDAIWDLSGDTIVETPLQVPEGMSGVGVDVSADGGVILGSIGVRAEPRPDTSPRARAEDSNDRVLWQKLADGSVGPPARLGLPPQNGDYFDDALSDDGFFVAGRSNTAGPFRWDRVNGFLPLGTLDGKELAPRDIADGGSRIIGGTIGATNQTLAFVWDQGLGARSLGEVLIGDCSLAADLAGWTLLAATSMTPDGCSVVGSGLNPDGQNVAWLARMCAPAICVPEPAASLLGAAGLLAALTITRSMRCRRAP